MKKIKHLSLLLAAALITVSVSAQTDNTKPAAKAQPAPAKPSMLTNQKPLKMQPPTKLPAATKPVQPGAGTQPQPAKPSGK
jgi:PBP1b-binding outer membrane lipoprotein LpoB